MDQSFSVAQLGARMHYAVPRLLNQAGLLDRLFTDWHSPSWLRALMSPVMRGFGMAARMVGRSATGIPQAKIRAYPHFAVRYASMARRRGAAGAPEEAFLWAAHEFPQKVIRTLDKEGWPAALYAFNTAARDLFRAADKHGVIKILEQTIAPADLERDLVNEAAQRFPEWSPERGEPSHAQLELERLEREEWSLADHIVCGSQFVAEALQMRGVPASKLCVIPYGVETVGGEETQDAVHRAGPLRVLFAGAVGLRKGAPVLIEAARALREPVEFTLAGQWTGPSNELRKLPANVQCLGAVPRSAMTALYQSHDVLALPTVCEGSATVCYEAALHGLPVVTTANAGFPVADGATGFLIPLHDPKALAEKLAALAASPGLLHALQRETLRTRDQFTLEAYGKRLLGMIAAAPWEGNAKAQSTVATQG